MEYSGPAARSFVEEDLVLSDDDEWLLISPMDQQGPSVAPPEAGSASPDTEASCPVNQLSSAKRILNSSSDSNDASSSPVLKAAKNGTVPVLHDVASATSSVLPLLPHASRF